MAALFGLGLVAAHLLKDVLPGQPDASFKRADINIVTLETSCLSGSPSVKQVLYSLPGQLLTHVHSMS